MENKRKLSRYKAHLPVIFHDNFHAENKFEGRIIDINLEGVNIFSPIPYAQGKIICMNIDFKDGKTFYTIMGEVKHMNKIDNGWNIGVEIINYNIYHLKKIVDAIHDLTANNSKEIV